MIIFLDYDGTLVPLREFPYLAKIDPKRKEFLRKLAKKHKVAIVTGRDKRSFSQVFGEVPPELYLITSHGARIYKGEKLVADFLKGKTPDLGPLKEKLRELPGTFLEEKEGCFALHYRSFEGDESKVKEVFCSFIKENPPLRVIEGKKVLEALYGDFDKGKGVERFLKFLNWDRKEEVIYIGDDTTDLDAVRTVRELGGRAYFVGRELPEAEGFFRDVDEVYRFLETLQEAVDQY